MNKLKKIIKERDKELEEALCSVIVSFSEYLKELEPKYSVKEIEVEDINERMLGGEGFKDIEAIIHNRDKLLIEAIIEEIEGRNKKIEAFHDYEINETGGSRCRRCSKTRCHPDWPLTCKKSNQALEDLAKELKEVIKVEEDKPK